MTTTPIIRPLTTEDLPFLLPLSREFCERDGIEWNEAERRNILLTFIAGEHHFGLVSEHDEQILGIILGRVRRINDPLVPENHRQLLSPFIDDNASYADIWELWVAAKHRRKGIATTLKRQFETEAGRRGASIIFTFQDPGNAPAIEMNRKLGYLEIGVAKMWDDVGRTCFVKRLRAKE